MTSQTEDLFFAVQRAFFKTTCPTIQNLERFAKYLAAENVFVASAEQVKAYEELENVINGCGDGTYNEIVDAGRAVLAAGPLPPREVPADKMTNREIGKYVSESCIKVSSYEEDGALIRALFQPSPAPGEQSPPKGPASSDETSAVTEKSAAGESPALVTRMIAGMPQPTPPAPAATRVAVRVELTRQVAVNDTYENAWQIKYPGIAYVGSYRWETRTATLHADLPGDGR